MADAPITTSFPPSPVNPNLNKTSGKDQTGHSTGKNQPQKAKASNKPSDFERELASTSRKPEPETKQVTKPRPPVEKPSKNVANDPQSQRSSHLQSKDHSSSNNEPKSLLKNTKSQPTKAAPQATAEAAAKSSSTQNLNATTNDPSRDNPTQKSLQPLKKAAANNKSAVDASPVVALLTGHLDRLNPETIPELVSSNNFVTSAISYDEINAYLNKPTPVRELLENLDVPQQILDEAEEMGFDTSVIISPNDILRALGLDPQRVFAELKQLKDSLPIDGVQSYMKRASIMQKSNSSDGSTQPDPLSRAKLQRDAEAAKALTQSLPIQTAQNFSVKDSLEGKQSSQARTQLSATEPQYFVGSSNNTEQFMASPQLTFSPQSKTNDLLSARVEDNVKKISARFGNQNLTAEQLIEIQALSKNVSDDSISIQTYPEFNQNPEQNTQRTLTSSQFGQLSSMPRLQSATFDGFAAIGQNLDPEQTVKWQDPDTISATPPMASASRANSTNVNLDRLIVEMSSIEKANGTEPKNTKEQLRSELLQEKSEITNQKTTDLRLIELNQGQVADRRQLENPVLKDIWQAMLPEYESLSSSNMPSENLSDTLNQINEISNQSIERLDSSEYDLTKNDQQSSSEQKPSDFGVSTDSNLTQAAHSNRDHSTRFESELANLNEPKPITNYSEITQKILDRASMLSRDGGGIINIDLSSPEMGRVELAMNFQNDRIDLRIMAENEQARDAISSGIGQIRDALSMQNIQLGSAEVGVGKRDTNQNNQFLGAFQQQQSQRQFGDNDSRRERARNWQSDLENQTRILTQPINQQAGLTRNYIKSPDTSDIDGLISVRA